MLLANGAKILPFGARAMDLLIVLVEQANKVVGWRTLIECAIRTNFRQPTEALRTRQNFLS
jgi:DNA-binding winged helix-turn-helix (wHTH) protein